MAGLQQKKIKDSYKSLLRVDDDTHGIDGSLANITDGEGTAGPFQISSTEVSFPSSSTLSLVNLKAESATQGFHINLTDSNGDDKNKISIPDNVDTAFSIKESGNLYMKFTTTTGSEIVEFGKDVEMQGNLQVNGTIVGSSINFNSVDMTNVDIDSGTIDGVTINSSAIGAGGESTGAFTTLTASDAVTFSKSTNGDYKAQIFNANAGTATEANIYITNSSSTSDGLFAGIGGTGFTTAGGFVQDGAWIGSGTGASGGLSLMTRANANMRFYTNGHTNLAMVIDSSQRVGIGITSPSSYHSSTQLAVGNTSGEGQITIVSGSSNDANINFADGTSGTATAEGIIRYKHSNNQMELYTGQALALTIDSSQDATFAGTITVGASNGSEEVKANRTRVRHIDGLADASDYSHGDLFINHISSGNIICSSNVGIGTTSPSDYSTSADDLVVKNSDHAGITIVSPTNKSSNLFFADGTSGNEQFRGFIQYDHGNNLTDAMSIGTAGVERLRIKSDGVIVSQEGIEFQGSTLSSGQTGIASSGGGGDLRIFTNGIQSTTFKSDGKVGIGTTSPSEVLQINHSASDGDSGILIVNESTSIGNDTFLGGIGFDSADGNVPSTVGEASAAIVARSAEAHGTGDKGGNLLFLTSAVNDDDDTGSHERMRIDSTGGLTSNTTNDNWIYEGDNSHASAPYGIKLHWNNSAPDHHSTEWLFFQDTSATRFIVKADGDVQNHDNTYGSTSDKRIKQGIKDANSQWDDIKAVKVRNFKKNDDVAQYGDKAWQQIGVIAQELEESGMDKLVKEYPATKNEIALNDDIKEGDMIKAVSYSVLYMKAIKALQEAMEKIETLETKVEALENA